MLWQPAAEAVESSVPLHAQHWLPGLLLADDTAGACPLYNPPDCAADPQQVAQHLDVLDVGQHHWQHLLQELLAGSQQHGARKVAADRKGVMRAPWAPNSVMTTKESSSHLVTSIHGCNQPVSVHQQQQQRSVQGRIEHLDE